MTLVVPPFTFAAVAQPVAAHGWRPFPGRQSTKAPALKGWSDLNNAEWDNADLAATITEFQPVDDYCCCFAVQAEIVAIDADIVALEHAAFADKLANDILGVTPLVRIGAAPKCIRVYRAGDHIKTRKLHPLEIFCGSGQFIAFGWHAKAGRPYIWPCESPLTIAADSRTIPAVKRAQIERFTTELFKVVPRRLLPTRQRRSGAGAPQTIGERLRMLTMLHGSWKRAAALVLSEAGEGVFNETLWAVAASAAGRGIPEDVVWELVERHFNRDPKVSEAKLVTDLASMIERTRRTRAQPSSMIFTPDTGDGDCNGR
jgi:hypothetical protein